MGQPLLGPYVSDPMHLQLSNSYVGIFFGVNYGGAKGVEILLVTMDWTSVGGGESCMQIFSHGLPAGMGNGA